MKNTCLICRGSSAGRALDWKSRSHQFNSGLRHHQWGRNTVTKTPPKKTRNKGIHIIFHTPLSFCWFFCLFFIMCLLTYIRWCGSRVRTLFYIFRIYRNKNYLAGESFYIYARLSLLFTLLLLVYMDAWERGLIQSPAKGPTLTRGPLVQIQPRPPMVKIASSLATLYG